MGAIGVTRVVYTDISPQMKEAIERIVAKWVRILPSWCHELTVRQDDTTEAKVEACFTVSPEYRGATLFVYPRLMAYHDIERVIVHEFCHAYTTPIARVAKEFCDDAFSEPTPGSKTMERRIDDMTEGATEDLAALLMRMEAASDS